MLVLLAPSKTMTMDGVLPSGLTATTPLFMSHTKQIVEAVRGQDMVSLMGISDALARSVKKVYEEWGSSTAPAIYAYHGDVYRWFFAETLSKEDLRWAQDHLLILSGLYGVVRPLDAISPYRLEMKAKLEVGSHKDLYEFWDTILSKTADALNDSIVCNLSSDEYARVITRYTKKRVVTPVFLDNKTNGTVGTVPIYSKMMRGVMARWIIDNRIEDPRELRDFISQGYRYDEARSTENEPVFYREVPKPIRF
ncbi:MAG TPA: YaaA family protein [Candidatus Saccharimonadales bacterium]|nr:YaaA family protein [Candidatus Saccharimonadales bacterium]